jgi:hypothetical protein
LVLWQPPLVHIIRHSFLMERRCHHPPFVLGGSFVDVLSVARACRLHAELIGWSVVLVLAVTVARLALGAARHAVRWVGCCEQCRYPLCGDMSTMPGLPTRPVGSLSSTRSLIRPNFTGYVRCCSSMLVEFVACGGTCVHRGQVTCVRNWDRGERVSIGNWGRAATGGRVLVEVGVAPYRSRQCGLGLDGVEEVQHKLRAAAVLPANVGWCGTSALCVAVCSSLRKR